MGCVIGKDLISSYRLLFCLNDCVFYYIKVLVSVLKEVFFSERLFSANEYKTIPTFTSTMFSLSFYFEVFSWFWSWVLFRVISMDLFVFFYMQLTILPAPFAEDAVSFLGCIYIPYQSNVFIGVWIHVLDFNSI